MPQSATDAPLVPAPTSSVIPPGKKRLHLGTRVSQRIAMLLLMVATRFVQRLSAPAAMRFGTRLGRLAHKVAKRPRQKAMRNLHLVYPEWSDAERAALTGRVFVEFGKSVVDFLRVPGLTDEQMGDLVTATEGWEHLEAARTGGRGFIIVTGHIGNFELLGRWLALKGVPSSAVAREPVDPALAAYTRRMREYGGNQMIPKGTSARELLSRLGRGKVITLGVDQNSGDIFLPFLGVPAGTVTGPAKLALHKGVVLLPAFCLREPDDSYRIVFLPPIVPVKTDDRDAEIERLTIEINRALESVVCRAPAQWLWLHSRWKATFETKNRARLPSDFDFENAAQRYRSE